MKVALHSPMEALESSGLIPTVDGFVTWVAVLTAAISFLGIRAIGLKSGRPKSSINIDQCQTTSNSPVLVESREESAVSLSSCSGSCLPSSNDDREEDGTVKGKFSLYFEGDGGDDCSSQLRLTKGEGLVDGIGCVVDDEGYRGWESWDWERMLVRRRLEHPGWYCYQNLRTLDGSVVRLWDSSVQKTKLAFK